MRSSKKSTTPEHNLFLAALPPDVYARLLPELELQSMEEGTVLHDAGKQMSHVYFPTTCVVSLLHRTEKGGAAEIAITGVEGLVGVSLFMGGETAPSQAVLRNAGEAFRLKAGVLKREFEQGGALQDLALRFTQSLIIQMAQTSVCNRHHSVEQQLCRWILMTIDRIGGSELIATQEMIAGMLGVRRVGVMAAAGRLQEKGLIRYGRGHIKVIDRAGLEARVCECYGVVSNELGRLLPYSLRRAPGKPPPLPPRHQTPG